jgi:hypothetical protein
MMALYFFVSDMAVFYDFYKNSEFCCEIVTIGRAKRQKTRVNDKSHPREGMALPFCVAKIRRRSECQNPPHPLFRPAESAAGVPSVKNRRTRYPARLNPPPTFCVAETRRRRSGLLVFVAVEGLDVDCVLHRFALVDRRLGEVLAAAQLLEDAGAFVFPFKFLEGALDVFALFYRHDDHFS